MDLNICLNLTAPKPIEIRLALPELAEFSDVLRSCVALATAQSEAEHNDGAAHPVRCEVDIKPFKEPEETPVRLVNEDGAANAGESSAESPEAATDAPAASAAAPVSAPKIATTAPTEKPAEKPSETPAANDGAAAAPMELADFIMEINRLISSHNLRENRERLSAIGHECNTTFAVKAPKEVPAEKRGEYIAFMKSAIARAEGAANA